MCRKAVLPTAVLPQAEGSSSIGQSPGLQNRWLGVRVPPALRVRSGETARPGGRIGEDMATQTRGEAPEKRSGSGRAAKRESRTTPALFFRQIVSELRKVIWPTRSMLVTYTVVCLVFVIFMVIVVTSLDYGFTKLVFALFG